MDGLFTTDDGSSHQERDSPNGGISGNVSKILLHGFSLSGSIGCGALASNY
jgi:hypothetical protein